MRERGLKVILEKHRMFLDGDHLHGELANLKGADLEGAKLHDACLKGANLKGANLDGASLKDADLCGANLKGASLKGADLYDVNLYDVDLRDADLKGANLKGAKLHHADLENANLEGADLYHANLYGVNLRDANLKGTNLYDANLEGTDLENITYDETTSFMTMQCPEKGSFIGYKKCRDGIIVKLLIPEDARRSSATTYKCRCDKALVLEITDTNRENVDEAFSVHDPEFAYRTGEVVKIENFHDDRWRECAPGIHFFISRKEAESYYIY